MRLALALVVACGRPPPLPPRAGEPLSAGQWTARCADHIELARRSLVPLDRAFLDARLSIDSSPWNPMLRLEVGDTHAGYWEASVQHGRGPCIDFDDGPEYDNMPWRDGSSAPRVIVDRIMRMDGDEAWLQANRVSRTSAIAFRRELQRALEACLRDARGVELADAPPGFCNLDAEDRCPDEPSSEDGCPDPEGVEFPAKPGIR